MYVCVHLCFSVFACPHICLCPRVACLLHAVFCCLFVGTCVCVCVGQGSRHAAVCRPAVPVNGRTADDTTTADGGGSEVAGTGGEAAGNTHATLWDQNIHTH